jgi:hypothetical protein
LEFIIISVGDMELAARAGAIPTVIDAAGLACPETSAVRDHANTAAAAMTIAPIEMINFRTVATLLVLHRRAQMSASIERAPQAQPKRKELTT